MKNNYGASEDKLAHYVCKKTRARITIDGDLTKTVWREAERSRRFVDLVTGEPGFFDTRMAALWDDRALYIAFWMEEPCVRASLTKRDSFIWHDNDIEVFIGGDDCYYEFEMNAFNTVYEVFFIYQDALKKGSRFDKPEFDLYERDVDVLSGFQDASRNGKHHRGKRWAFMDWDFPGMESAVCVQGAVNNPCRVSTGWTAEIMFPWAGMKNLFARRSLPPVDGDTLRASFSRFETMRYNGARSDISAGWALNEHGVYDSHIPECFSVLHFQDERK